MEFVEFDVEELTDSLKELGARARNQRAVNEQIAEVMHALVEEKFDEQGPGWPELAPATLKRRRGGSRILQSSGHLAQSVQPAAGADFALVFTNLSYGGFHLTGTGDMPQRDYFDIDMDNVFDQAEEIVLESITR